MIPTSCSRLLLGLSLAALIAACGGPGKPAVKLSVTPTTLEDGQEIALSATVTGGQGSSKVEFFKSAEKVGEDSSAPYELKFNLNSSEDATLLFSAKATAADNQFGLSDPVSVNVKADKTPPAVVLSASSSTLSAAGAVTLSATATDNKGVVKVEFFKGPDKLGEDTTPADGFSFSINLSATDNGSLKYRAKAYDAKGNVGTSAEVSVTVDVDTTNPTISLSSDKTNVTLAGSATLTANASDDKGVAWVEFYIVQSTGGANKLGEDTQAPFTFTINFTAAANGSHTYSAKAFDALGNSATSNEVSISVDIDATLPAVSLATDKPNITVAEAATLTARASDDKGIVKVEFFEGANKLFEDTESPFVHPISFTDAGNGTHTYTAKATDTSGNIATSDPVSIVVDIDMIYPKVSLNSDLASLDAAGSINLSATASDNKGVVKVEFYKNGGKMGEDTDGLDGFGFKVDYTTDYKATDIFTAKAFDGAGHATNSNSVSVSIYIDTILPTIALDSSTSLVYGSGSATLTATAGDSNGIAKVEFYKGDNPTPIATDTNGTDGYIHTLNFTPADFGTYTYTAKAYDTKGNTQDTAQVGVKAFSFSQIATGYFSSCAIGSDSKAYCWGNGSNGALGNGATSSSSVPVAVSAGAVPEGVSLSQIAAGASYACTLGSDSKAYCWGTGSDGRLGYNSTAHTSIPVAVYTSGVLNGVALTQLSASYDHPCVIDSSNKAYCWGYGRSGQLGNGSSNDSSIPVAVSAGAIPAGVTIAQVEAGYDHTCAVGSDKLGYCWGSGGNGRLGNNATSNSNVPVAVDTSGVLSGISLIQIAAGHDHSCAIASSGKAYCWGNGSNGGLGNNSTTTSNVPVAVDTLGVLSGVTLTQIAAGNTHTCALSSEGKVYCWGLGTFGQLGNGSSSSSNVPVAVSAGEIPAGVTLTKISVNNQHTCAIGSDGRAYCWGNGSNGVLGNNSTSNSNVPVLVNKP